MANFVLVHGGWRGGWTWKRVARQLRDEGHDVYAPTLTGLADRNHLPHADINLSIHIQEIVSLVRLEELNNVILCGHCYAGMIISSLTDRISERISSLVYLNAWRPKDGDSIMTLSPDEYQPRCIKHAGHHGVIACSPIPAVAFHVNERDRA
jgi:pimeloyl-ACP methyl ester carboxylesterase